MLASDSVNDLITLTRMFGGLLRYHDALPPISKMLSLIFSSRPRVKQNIAKFFEINFLSKEKTAMANHQGLQKIVVNSRASDLYTLEACFEQNKSSKNHQEMIIFAIDKFREEPSRANLYILRMLIGSESWIDHEVTILRTVESQDLPQFLALLPELCYLFSESSECQWLVDTALKEKMLQTCYLPLWFSAMEQLINRIFELAKYGQLQLAD